MTSNHPFGDWLLHVTGNRTATLNRQDDGQWRCKDGRAVAVAADPIDALWNAVVGGPPPSVYATDLNDLLG